MFARYCNNFTGCFIGCFQQVVTRNSSRWNKTRTVLYFWIISRHNSRCDFWFFPLMVLLFVMYCFAPPLFRLFMNFDCESVFVTKGKITWKICCGFVAFHWFYRKCLYRATCQDIWKTRLRSFVFKCLSLFENSFQFYKISLKTWQIGHFDDLVLTTLALIRFFQISKFPIFQK